jgi:hypothetical protein
MDNIIEANCEAFWGSSSKDIVKCINTWKNAKQWGEVHAPLGAEPNSEFTKPENKYIAESYNQALDASKKPIAEICPEWTDYGDNAGSKGCATRNQTKFKRWWTTQLEDTHFEQNTNKANWLGFKKEGETIGWMPLTGDGERGIEMNGAWEVTYATADYVQVTLYAGQSECTFSVSQKGKLWWFEQTSANYSNICPSTLMKKQKVIPLSEYKEEFKLPPPSNNG